jgi:hypothetical protein
VHRKIRVADAHAQQQNDLVEHMQNQREYSAT